MSVRKGDRSDGELQVLNCARMLRNHSFQLCSNEKVYPKSKRWCLAQPTLQAALSVAENIAAANVTSLKEGQSCENDYRMRRECQVLAMQDIQRLLTLIEMAKDAGYLEGRTEYWVKLVHDTKTLLKKWMNSDEQRFLEIMQGQ